MDWGVLSGFSLLVGTAYVSSLSFWTHESMAKQRPSQHMHTKYANPAFTPTSGWQNGSPAAICKTKSLQPSEHAQYVF